MSVDEIVKLVFFIGITLSIVGVSVQIMRILAKLADMMEDIRPSVRNINDLSTQAVEDYKSLGEGIRAIANSLKQINENVIKPVSSVGKVVSSVKSGLEVFGIGKNKSNSDDNKEDK